MAALVWVFSLCLDGTESSEILQSRESTPLARTGGVGQLGRVVVD